MDEDHDQSMQEDHIGDEGENRGVHNEVVQSHRRQEEEEEEEDEHGEDEDDEEEEEFGPKNKRVKVSE